jgi:VCBS repeat-containing protein
VASASGNVGSLTLAADGSYTYAVANSAVQYLGGSDTKVDTFTVTSFDGTTKDVSFTVQGVYDAAVIGDPTAASVIEDVNVTAGTLSAAGTLSVTDVDQNQSSFKTSVISAAGNLGSLTLAADGSYTYAVANSAAQYLGGSDTKVDTFSVTSFDGTTKDVSFTVQGANDAAVIGDPTAASVTEDANVSAGSLSATGTLSVTDVDQNQSSFQTSVASAAGNLGSFTLAADGSYTYAVANSAVQHLGASDT